VAPLDAPHPDAPSRGLDRRVFCLSALATGVTMACGGGGGANPTPAPPPATTGPMTTTDTRAFMLSLPNGTARDYRNLGNFFLIKDATGIFAMTAICTHLGCTVGAPIGSQITCPCHGSQYDLNGANLLGPAVLPLVHFPVTESSPGGPLVVNTAQTVAASIRFN
jgi:Rieske Fe-S protein